MFPGLWAVVNNAGIFQYPIDAELIPMAQYRKCMAVNFFGAVEVTKVFLPLLRRSKGRLVNVCSLGGESAWWHVVTWCLSHDMELFTLCRLHKRARLTKAGWITMSQSVSSRLTFLSF